MSTPNVFRDEIKEGRTGYFVTYQPADCRLPFASIDLVFLDEPVDNAHICRAMEAELKGWLARYAVPVMVSAFDLRESLIRVRGDSTESHLMGYRDSKTGQTVQRWGLFKDDELPSEQTNAEYLQSAYRDLGFREQEAVREAAQREARNTGRAARAIIFFVVAVPVLIEIISLGVSWLGYILSAISITIGLIKAAKAFGWIKPSERAKAKADEARKMRHYYYHCERNPEAFNRLKMQNFERELIERTRKEAQSLGIKTESLK